MMYGLNIAYLFKKIKHFKIYFMEYNDNNVEML